MRSSIDIEFASLVVPNGARPQSCDNNHRQCVIKRSVSGARSALNGVTTGASTPRIRSFADRILVSGIVAFVAAAVPVATDTLVSAEKSAVIDRRYNLMITGC